MPSTHSFPKQELGNMCRDASWLTSSLRSLMRFAQAHIGSSFIRSSSFPAKKMQLITSHGAITPSGKRLLTWCLIAFGSWPTIALAFMVYNACGGGTGSGLGCLMLERLSVDYGKKS